MLSLTFAPLLSLALAQPPLEKPYLMQVDLQVKIQRFNPKTKKNVGRALEEKGIVTAIGRAVQMQFKEDDPEPAFENFLGLEFKIVPERSGPGMVDLKMEFVDHRKPLDPQRQFAAKKIGKGEKANFVFKVSAEEEYQVVVEAQTHPGFLDRNPQLIPQLIRSLRHDDMVMHPNVEKMLLFLGPEVIPELLATVKGSDKKLQLRAMPLLAQIVKERRGAGEEVIQVLTEFLEQEDLDLRRAAAAAMRLILTGN